MGICLYKNAILFILDLMAMFFFQFFQQVIACIFSVQILDESILVHKLLQPSQRILADGGLQEGRPAEKRADGTERLARPARETEAVSVLEDQAVFEDELGFDDVAHFPLLR